MKSLINRLKDEKGFAIVEATLIFPVVFFVLFFIIFIGNIYFLMSQIDSMAIRHCINGAESIADPMYYDMAKEETDVTKLIDKSIYPYRYLFGEIGNGSINTAEKNIKEDINKEFKDGLVILWDYMKPMISSDDDIKVECDNYFIYSKFTVDISYKVPFPLKLFDNEPITMFRRTAHAEVSVNDSPEFVRNVDMVVDLLEDSKFGEKIKSLFSKVSEFLNKVKGSGENKE
ncbi:MAG: TadE/TadG family type IV pilus assembly protein [Clostridiales bacterium]|nr:TadE/TadG family type IV pilus assembly protein [Clostridiales bacterium]